MDVLLTERQLSELKKLLEQDATADPAAQAPTAGTSSKQAGGQGYPEVGKWESGVTRGPANQVGITKWADVVGSKLNRGKANPLKENEYTKEGLLNLMEQVPSLAMNGVYDAKTGKLYTQGDFRKINYNGKEDTDFVYARKVFPNIKDDKYPSNIDTQLIQDYFKPKSFSLNSNINNYDRLAVGSKYGGYAVRTTDVERMAKIFPSKLTKNVTANYVIKGTSNYWKGKPQPEKPKPYNGDILSSQGTELPEQPWGYYDGILGNLESQNSQYETDMLEWAKNNNLELYYGLLRKSPNGLSVPPGYAPIEYDEYRAQVDPLVKQIELLKTKPNPNGGWYNTTQGVSVLSDKETKQLGDLRWKVNLLNKEYYSKDYPNGLSKKDKEEFNSYNNRIKEYYKEQYEINGCDFNSITKILDLNKQPIIKNDNDATRMYHPDYSKYNFDSTTPTPKPPSKESICLKLQSEENNSYEKIKEYFNYSPDKRSKFDKFWDEWGTIIQIGGSLALSLVLPEIGVPMASATFAAIDTTFNIAIAAYQLSRGQDTEAGVSVLFAILPYLKVGKLLIPKDIAKSISKKLSAASIKTSADMVEFMKTLTEAEQKWFKTVLNADKSLLKNASKEVIDRYTSKLEASGYKVSKSTSEKVSKKFLDKSISAAKAAGMKTAPLWIRNPKLLQTTFELGVFWFAPEWLHSIEEKAKIKLDEKQKKNLEAFFNNIPDELRQSFTSEMKGEDIANVAEGNMNAIQKVSKNVDDYIHITNPKTGKPYTKEEYDQRMKNADDSLNKYFAEHPMGNKD